MTSAEDYIIRFIGKDSITKIQKEIQKGDKGIQKSGQEAEKQLKKTEKQTEKTSKKMRAMKVAIGGALSGIAGGLTMFTQQAISNAIDSEQAWVRVYSVMHLAPKEWDTQGKAVKKWASDFASANGMVTGDVRDAITQSVTFGNTWEETQRQVEISASVSIATGKSIADTQKMLQYAYMNKGRAFERITGIELKNYKLQDGTIDKTKLNAELQKRYGQTLQDYRNTEYAQMVRAQNQWARMNTLIGAELVPALMPLVELLTQILNVFNSLPQGAKTFMAYGVLATIAMSGLSGPLTLIEGLFGKSNIKLGSFTGGMKNAKLGAVGLKSALLGVSVVLAGLMVAWGIYSYFNSESEKRMEKYKKQVTDAIPTLRDLRDRLKEINKELEKDPTNKGLQTKKAKTEAKIKEQWDKIGQGWRSQMHEQAGWDTVAKGITLGNAPLPRNTTGGAMAEFGSTILGASMGGQPMNAYETRQIDQMQLLLQYRDAEAKKIKANKKLSADEKKSKLKDLNNDVKTAGRQLGLSDKQIKANEKLYKSGKKLDKAVKDIMGSLGKLGGAIWKLLGALFGWDDKNNTTTGKNKDGKDKVDDFADAVSRLAGWVDQVTKDIEWWKQKIDELTTSLQNAYNWIMNVKGESPTISNAGNVTTDQKGNALTPQQQQTGKEVNQKINGQYGALFSTNSVPEFKNHEGSPLRMEIGGKTVARFPQVKGLISRLNKFGKMPKGGLGGEVHYHSHNENVTFDTRHMGVNQLKGLFIEMLEGTIKPKTVPTKGSV